MNVKIGDRFVGITVMRGENGKTPEIRLEGKVLQYRFDADGEWQTIFDFSTVETVKGDPGDTPYIGANGNWFIGDTDTGVPARGTPGAKGDRGDPGTPGANGVNGKTPVRGTDYWTEADKTEIKSYVDEAIVNGEW